MLNAAQAALQFSVSSVTRDIALLGTSWVASLDSGLEAKDVSVQFSVTVHCRRLRIARGCYGVLVTQVLH